MTKKELEKHKQDEINLKAQVKEYNEAFEEIKKQKEQLTEWKEGQEKEYLDKFSKLKEAEITLNQKELFMNTKLATECFEMAMANSENGGTLEELIEDATNIQSAILQIAENQ